MSVPTWNRREFLRVSGSAVGTMALAPTLSGLTTTKGMKTRHVVLIAFAGGVRSRDTIGTPQNVPNLMNLANEGVVYPNCNVANLGHYGATLSIFTGIPEAMGIRDQQRGFHPTVFEYLRKGKELPASQCWLTSNNGTQAVNFAFGLHRDYGSAYGANVIDGDQLFNQEFRDVMQQFGQPQTDSEQEQKALAQLRGAINGRRHPSGVEGLNDAATAARVEQYILEELRSDRTTRMTGPGAADAKALQVAGKIMQIFRPSLLGISLTNADIAHGSYNAYVDVIRRNDAGLGELCQIIRSDSQLRDSTSIFVLPEFGRDRDLNNRNGLDHGDNSADVTKVSCVAWDPTSTVDE